MEKCGVSKLNYIALRSILPSTFGNSYIVMDSIACKYGERNLDDINELTTRKNIYVE